MDIVLDVKDAGSMNIVRTDLILTSAPTRPAPIQAELWPLQAYVCLVDARKQRNESYQVSKLQYELFLEKDFIRHA